MTSAIYGKSTLALLALSTIWASTAAADGHRLGGRWRDESTSVGVIQSGQTVYVFGRSGWCVGKLEPLAAGMLAYGEGNWTFGKKLQRASVSVGESDGHLYLVITPIGAYGASEIKMILEPIVPIVPPKKA